MSTNLDPFQSALLEDLRAEVAARQPLYGRRPRWTWPAAAAAVAVGAGAWLTVSTTAPTPAYAVTTETDGDVAVRIHDVRNLDGLEEALADEGVTADVSSFDLDPGHQLVLGEELSQVADPAAAPDVADGAVWSDAAACGSTQASPRRQDMPVQVTHADDYEITLDGELVSSERTLRVTTVTEDDRAGQLFVSYSLTGSGYCGAIVGLD